MAKAHITALTELLPLGRYKRPLPRWLADPKGRRGSCMCWQEWGIRGSWGSYRHLPLRDRGTSLGHSSRPLDATRPNSVCWWRCYYVDVAETELLVRVALLYAMRVTTEARYALRARSECPALPQRTHSGEAGAEREGDHIADDRGLQSRLLRESAFRRSTSGDRSPGIDQHSSTYLWDCRQGLSISGTRPTAVANREWLCLLVGGSRKRVCIDHHQQVLMKPTSVLMPPHC